MENLREQHAVSPVQYSSVSTRPRGKSSTRGKGATSSEPIRAKQKTSNNTTNPMDMGDYVEEQPPEYQDEYREPTKLYPSIESTRDIDELYKYMQVIDGKIESMNAALKEVHTWLLAMKVNQSVPTGVPVAQNMSAVGRMVKPN